MISLCCGAGKPNDAQTPCSLYSSFYPYLLYSLSLFILEFAASLQVCKDDYASNRNIWLFSRKNSLQAIFRFASLQGFRRKSTAGASLREMCSLQGCCKPGEMMPRSGEEESNFSLLPELGKQQSTKETRRQACLKWGWRVGKHLEIDEV